MNTAPTRLVTDGNMHIYAMGQLPNGVLHIERRAQDFGPSTTFNSNAALTLVDTIRSPNPNTVLALATVEGPGVSMNGQPIPYTMGSQGNVVLLRVNTDNSQPVTVTTWDRPGDQRAVGFAHANNPGAENRVIIIGNQGTDAFIWSVPHPP